MEKLTSFEVGSGDDSVAPSMPIEESVTLIRQRTGWYSSMCSTKWMGEADVTHDDDSVLLVDIRLPGTFENDPLFDSEVAWAAQDGLVPLGGSCGARLPDGAALELRYGAVDRVGNFSGWTEPSVVERQGCSSTGARRSMLGALGLAFCGLLRRREVGRMGQPLLASAALDRLAHDAHQIVMDGRSYRTGRAKS